MLFSGQQTADCSQPSAGFGQSGILLALVLPLVLVGTSLK